MDVKGYNTRSFSPRSQKPRRKKRVTGRFFLFLFIILAAVTLVVLAITAFNGTKQPEPLASAPQESGTASQPAVSETAQNTNTAEPSPSVTPSATPTLGAELKPQPAGDSIPSKYGFVTEIEANKQKAADYSRPDGISFPEADAYNKLEGVTTFRGNNYRTGGSYGTADVDQGKLEIAWENDIGAIDGWTGACWTGQPLIVKWPEATKKNMNMNDTKKTKTDLKEVIYPTADGKIYFLDLDDGKATRNSINIGVPTKGTASIDPRGYPILYTGQGINSVNGKSVSVKFRAFNLLDQKLLWEFGGKDPFSYRAWQAYDSSPLIDPSSDTLVTGGENGILYTAKLNSSYDEASGTLTFKPAANPLVKYRYKMDEYGNGSNTRWWGIENSIAGWRNYAFFTDNGGFLQCVDLNTMKQVYALDVTDDSDCSMPLEADTANNTFYLYTANEVDKQKGAKTSGKGKAYHRKIDGLTGKIIWEKEYVAYTSTDPEGNNGGTVTSPVLGKGDISNLIIYSMTMVPIAEKDSNGKNKTGGRIVAYNRDSGEVAWTVETAEDYWSSPLGLYDENGKSYIVQCDRKGFMKLYEGLSGKLLDTLDLCKGGTTIDRIDATPAAFGNMIVVGTRDQKIVGVRIK